MPASVQVKALGDFRDPITREPYEGIGHYNLASCKGTEYLETCFDEVAMRGVTAGTLSHSHLLLVLICVKS